MPVAINSRLGADANTSYILAQSAVPVCLAPNGTVATNGTVTLGTALPATYSGGIWLRLPADAVVGGLAGLYWAVMSNTTTGQVYTNFVDPASAFTPYTPSGTLVAATGSNGAYTQATASDITLVNVTLPGNALGVNGTMRHRIDYAMNNTANAKTAVIKADTTQIASHTLTSGVVYPAWYVFKNRGAANRNISTRTNTSLVGAIITSGAYQYLAVDTAVSKAINHTVNSATATDYIIIEGFEIEILPS